MFPLKDGKQITRGLIIDLSPEQAIAGASFKVVK
jgi:hypothetical protein